jgi:hypothetical protein
MSLPDADRPPRPSPLVGEADATGRVDDPVLAAYRRDIDRTLLRKNLSLTPEQRLLQLMELQRFAEELRRAGEALRRS